LLRSGDWGRAGGESGCALEPGPRAPLIKGGKRFHVLHGHTYSVNSVAFSPNGRTLASHSGNSGTIALWDVNTRTRLHEVPSGGSYSVAFSPDGRTLASDGDGSTIALWNVASGKRLRVLRGHSKVVDSVAFSPDGSTLASGSFDGTIALWDIASGTRLHVLSRSPRRRVERRL
jgi:WD40 repeat protein